MKCHFLSRMTALSLSLALLAAPTAQALTTEQAAELIQELYVDEVPQSVLDQPTVEDMIDALGDPYTEYFTPDSYAGFTASMSDDSLVGIGVVFSITEDGLLISQVLSNSPAEKGDLQTGDIIVSVDGKNVPGMDQDTVTDWIQGKEGTTVKISFLRDGKKRSVTLTRATVILPATTSELVDGHIGYISCTTFGNETLGHFKEALDAHKEQADVWIVDLRSNLGGVTSAAVDSAGLFTGPGEMAYLRNGADEYGSYVYDEDPATICPIIVLVDAYTASAAEIFASAIRDRGCGIVVGARTFGKGTAQTVMDQDSLPDYFPDGDALKVTSHRFFTAAGNTTDKVGVIPNLLVSPNLAPEVAELLSASIPDGDNQDYLRIDIDWRWTVDLEAAASPEYHNAAQALLNALPENTPLWLGTGGSGWSKTDLLSVADRLGLTSPDTGFSDQEESNYITALSVLKTYGLVKGKDDGLFHPQDFLTRAELCQLLAEALNLTVPTSLCPYTDVPPKAWYTPAVTAMTNIGLVNGTGGGRFSPEALVDHQQFITIMGRLAQRLNISFYNTAAQMPEGVENMAGLMDYAGWAKPSAWLLALSQKGFFGNSINLLWDGVSDIDPNAPTTRDEAVFLLYRLLNHTGILIA